MSDQVFRFGVTMLSPDGDWAARARRIEELGYDVVTVADHLGMQAPFPAAVAAAAATTRACVGTYLTNAAFWNPELLAREVAGTDALTGGRFEPGLSIGHAGDESRAANLDFPDAEARMAHLETVFDTLERRYADPEYRPRPARTPLPLAAGGTTDAELLLAARRADTVVFPGVEIRMDGSIALDDAATLLRRTALVRAEAGPRNVRLNIGVKKVVLTTDRVVGAEQVRPLAPHLTVDQLLDLPTVLVGTPQEIAEQVRKNADVYGFTYLTVAEWSAEDFAPVLALLRG